MGKFYSNFGVAFIPWRRTAWFCGVAVLLTDMLYSSYHHTHIITFFPWMSDFETELSCSPLHRHCAFLHVLSNTSSSRPTEFLNSHGPGTQERNMSGSYSCSQVITAIGMPMFSIVKSAVACNEVPQKPAMSASEPHAHPRVEWQWPNSIASFRASSSTTRWRRSCA